MCKFTTGALTLGLALASGTVLADDNSMSQWTGDSYKAFEADKFTKRAIALGTGESNSFAASPDNSTSRWNGDSYLAFERMRTSPAAVPATTAVASTEGKAINRALPAPTATRGRTPVNPFRNDTGA